MSTSVDSINRKNHWVIRLDLSFVDYEWHADGTISFVFYSKWKQSRKKQPVVVMTMDLPKAAFTIKRMGEGLMRTFRHVNERINDAKSWER
jgi:hypothetical protein